MAKTNSSPRAKRARKPYMLLKQKAPKHSAPPISVAVDKSCRHGQMIVNSDFYNV